MERFLASPYCKIIVLCVVLLVVLAFGYHVGNNLRLVRHNPVETAPPSAEQAPANSPPPPQH